MNFKKFTLISAALATSFLAGGCLNADVPAENFNVPANATGTEVSGTENGGNANGGNADLAGTQVAGTATFCVPELPSDPAVIAAEIQESEAKIADLQKQQAKLGATREMLLAEAQLANLELQLQADEIQRQNEAREREFSAKIALLDQERETLQLKLDTARFQADSEMKSRREIIEKLDLEQREMNLAKQGISTILDKKAELLAIKENSAKTIANGVPAYKDEPFDDVTGTLFISDRRVDLNEIITPEKVAEITAQINFYNQRDAKLPIFVVITSCPGGSARASQLLKAAFDSSAAPIYFVVKGHASGTIAAIVATAEHSFAFENAVFVQCETGFQNPINGETPFKLKESFDMLQYAINTTLEPVAKKMGFKKVEDFRKELFKHNSRGYWAVQATEAQELGWVNTIVARAEESSVLRDNTPPVNDTTIGAQTELPMLEDLYDFWWIFDPNGIYKQ